MFATYIKLVEHILGGGFEETNERTGVRIKMLPYPIGFPVDLRSRRLPVPGNRRVYPETAAREIAWFLSGTKTPPASLKIWDKFKEEDGSVEAAYGWRWRCHFDRDQIGLAIEALRKNPTDRRVFVSTWDPYADGLGAEGQRNVPCPVGFTFSIVQGHLNSAYLLRSSDVFVGLPYDVMGHALLMDAVAESVGAEGLGWMYVTLAHPHIYAPHFEMAEESLKKIRCGKQLMPRWPVGHIERDPEAYAAVVKEAADEIIWPEFNPRPELVL